MAHNPFSQLPRLDKLPAALLASGVWLAASITLGLGGWVVLQGNRLHADNTATQAQAQNVQEMRLSSAPLTLAHYERARQMLAQRYPSLQLTATPKSLTVRAEFEDYESFEQALSALSTYQVDTNALSITRFDAKKRLCTGMCDARPGHIAEISGLLWADPNSLALATATPAGALAGQKPAPAPATQSAPGTAPGAARSAGTSANNIAPPRP